MILVLVLGAGYSFFQADLQFGKGWDGKQFRDLTKQLKVLLILSHQHQQMEFTQLSSLLTDFFFFFCFIVLKKIH